MEKIRTAAREANRPLTPEEKQVIEKGEELLAKLNSPETEKPLSEAVEHFNKGESLRRDGRLTEAISEYLAAIKLDSKMEIASVKLAEVYNQTGKIKENAKQDKDALEDYKLAVTYNNADGWGYASLGHVQFKLNKPEDAVASLETPFPHISV
jgi:tetratricopeptide (TPR) repeat protein